MSSKKKEAGSTGLIGGSLNILGLEINLGELLAAPENLEGRLEELRDRLKQAGGKEALSDDEWKRGLRVSGVIRTRGALGDKEYHIGTAGRPGDASRPAAEPPEPSEPPVDVFEEAERITVVADVPGASLEDMELEFKGDVLTLATRATARRRYRKVIELSAAVAPDTMKTTCRNGVLEVQVRKQTPAA